MLIKYVGEVERVSNIKILNKIRICGYRSIL
jgi:hypothetical protein